MPKPNGNPAAVNLAYLEAAVEEVVVAFAEEEPHGKITQPLVRLAIAWNKYQQLRPNHVS